MRVIHVHTRQKTRNYPTFSHTILVYKFHIHTIFYLLLSLLMVSKYILVNKSDNSVFRAWIIQQV